MPNVEFFGFTQEEVEELKESIKERLRKSSVPLSLRDIVFTEHEFSDVRDVDEINMPYIRLASTPRKDIPEIIEVLKTLRVDLEYLELKMFIPAKK